MRSKFCSKVCRLPSNTKQFFSRIEHSFPISLFGCFGDFGGDLFDGPQTVLNLTPFEFHTLLEEQRYFLKSGSLVSHTSDALNRLTCGECVIVNCGWSLKVLLDVAMLLWCLPFGPFS